jgi:hypothetical protein
MSNISRPSTSERSRLLPKVVERNEDDDGGQRSDKSEVKNQSMVMYVTSPFSLTHCNGDDTDIGGWL